MSVPTLANFRAQFPEFTAASDALVQAMLDSATTRTPADPWDVDTDFQFDGILWLAAHLLALSPNAKELRIKGTAQTLYQEERRKLERIVHSGPFVSGTW